MFLNLILRETQKLDWLLKKNINPYNNYDDLINTVVFLCGRCFLLRGGREISKLLWENYTHGIYEDGPDKGKRYIQICIFEDKVNKRLRLGQKVLTVEDRSRRFRDNPNDPINPYEIFEYFCSICPPDQKRMCCWKHNQVLKHKRRVHKNINGVKDPIPYLTNPILPIVENTISKLMKRVAQICEFDNWEKCTNHGNRAYGVTILLIVPKISTRLKIYFIIADTIFLIINYPIIVEMLFRKEIFKCTFGHNRKPYYHYDQ